MTTPDPLPSFTGSTDDQDSLAASNAIRRYCGWHIAPRITQTFTINEPGAGPDIFVPSMKIHEITGCTVLGVDMTEDELAALDWSSAGYIGRGYLSGWSWPRRRRSVVITIDHGYELEEVPELAAMCRDLAGRITGAPAGIVRRQVGARSEEYERAMLGSDLATLDAYRIVGR